MSKFIKRAKYIVK